MAFVTSTQCTNYRRYLAKQTDLSNLTSRVVTAEDTLARIPGSLSNLGNRLQETEDALELIRGGMLVVEDRLNKLEGDMTEIAVLWSVVMALKEQIEPTQPPPEIEDPPEEPELPTAYSIMDYEADNTGVTSINTALAACAADAIGNNGYVHFPAGTYKLGSAYTTTEDLYYLADAGVTVKLGGSIKMLSGATLDGFNFTSDSSNLAVGFGTQSGSTVCDGATVKNCSFKAGAGHFSWSRIIMWLAHNCVVDNNTFYDPGSTGGNIQLIGGNTNTITNNSIDGGTTSILCMWSKTANGGGANSIIRDNEIAYNTFAHHTEEGISLDLKSNSAADCGCMEYTTISSIDGQNITLPALSFPDYTGYYVIFVDGDLAGKARAIDSVGGTGNKVLTLTGTLTGAANGNHIAIGAPYLHNNIHHNTGTDTEFQDYNLYGFCIGNTLAYNVSTQNRITVISLSHSAQATGSATLTGTQYGVAPNGYNDIHHNNVAQRLQLYHYAISPGSEAAYTTVGNNIYNNTAGGGVEVTNQNIYSADNGSVLNKGGCTFAAEAFVYDNCGV